MKTVQYLLDKKGTTVHSIDPLETVYEAIRIMQEKNIGALVVLVENFIVGIVSERDYVRKVILDHTASKETRVSEIMTREVVTVTTETSVSDCFRLMRDHHIRHLPVVENRIVLGIISLRDLFVEVTQQQDND